MHRVSVFVQSSADFEDYRQMNTCETQIEKRSTHPTLSINPKRRELGRREKLDGRRTPP